MNRTQDSGIERIGQVMLQLQDEVRSLKYELRTELRESFEKLAGRLFVPTPAVETRQTAMEKISNAMRQLEELRVKATPEMKAMAAEKLDESIAALRSIIAKTKKPDKEVEELVARLTALKVIYSGLE